MDEKKYQVFVSSTYEDLREERQEVMQALIELDCIPSGMELFPAADESAWEFIKQVIDDCDYYILILAGRYGSISSDGVSYTEKEYRYAISQSKPIIAFVHENTGKLAADKTEQKEDGKKKLSEFRKLVQNKLCKKWNNKDQLGSVVSRSISQLKKQHPAIGWIRANKVAGEEAAQEILNLRKEIQKLESTLVQARTTAPKGTEDLAQGHDVFVIRFAFTVPTGSYLQSQSYSGSLPVTWEQIFYHLAPTMINESSEANIKLKLNDLIHEQYHLIKKDTGPVAKYPKIDEKDLLSIIVQLRALGLITQSIKSRSVKDDNTYWTLTPYGDEYMTRLLAIKKSDFETDTNT